MAYLALYREWRPRTFAEIVGQKHVTRTLMNALAQDKVAHAYLFSGPRGTGKTTAAKILAKALNCEQRVGVEPCNSCDSCKGIDQGTAMEVMEIDAASNRGIDEIRDLREKVKLSAARGKFKVYIIDEVHMLTTEAFNALLKTLEEPPEQVIFILATTEAHKIPLTILSRVQRFEFYRVPLEDIKNRLTEVVIALGRQAEAEAIQVIAQKAEGGLRDALSILDQCLVYDDPLGVEEVYQVLGMVGETFSAQLVEAFLTADYGLALESLAQGIEQGRDPRQILRELLEYLRQSLLYLTTRQDPVIGPHLLDKLIQQSQSCGLDRLLMWIEVLLKGEGQLKYALNARLAAELLIVEAIHQGQTGRDKSGQLQESPVAAAAGAKGKKRMSALRKDNDKPAAVQEPHGREAVAGLSGKESLADGSTASSGTEVPADSSLQTRKETLPMASNIGITLEEINNKWPEILENIRQRKKSTHAFLLEGRPQRLDGDTLILVFRKGFSFHRDKVEQAENRSTIQAVLEELTGSYLGLRAVLEDETGGEAQPDPGEEQDRQDLIKRTVDIFGPEIVVIREDS
ncbi:MAG TPA: DNA polymerase III subunit gamma/tau [Desulfitobacteriaceae bacterium]|nr:DNA polymerase III subunit gamma/tau [Desulfitobacteriaceae bacterium]